MKKFLLALCLVIFAAANGYSGSVDTYGIGSKATSMGGAFSAYADDPFAVYYNPSGLTQLEKPMFALGVHMLDPSINIEDFYVQNHPDPGLPGEDSKADFSDESSNLFVPHIGFAMPVTDRLAFGVAAYAPWGMELDWNDDPEKNPGAYNFYHSYYDRVAVTPTVAYKVTDKLSVGVGVSIGRSEAGAEKRYYITPNVASLPGINEQYVPQVNQAIAAADAASPADITTTSQAAAVYEGALQTDPDNTAYQAAYGLTAGLSQMGVETAADLNGTAPIDHSSRLKIELEDEVNYSYNIGVMYKPVDTVTLGLTYRSETDTEFEGDTYINGQYVADARLEYNHPQQVQAGVRYAPNGRFSMEVDMVWTDWSINNRQVETLSDPVRLRILPGLDSPPIEIIESERDWVDTKQLRFGAEYRLNQIVILRCGYFYDPSPMPDHTLDLEWPDADKKTYSIGAGFNFDRFRIDTVFQYTDIEKAREVGGESENFNHSYSDRNVHVSADGYIIGAGATFTYLF